MTGVRVANFKQSFRAERHPGAMPVFTLCPSYSLGAFPKQWKRGTDAPAAVRKGEWGRNARLFTLPSFLQLASLRRVVDERKEMLQQQFPRENPVQCEGFNTALFGAARWPSEGGGKAEGDAPAAVPVGEPGAGGHRRASACRAREGLAGQAGHQQLSQRTRAYKGTVKPPLCERV
jgi:hypothetical protein